MIDKIIYKILEIFKIISFLEKGIFFIKKFYSKFSNFNQSIVAIYSCLIATAILCITQTYTIYIIKLQKKEITLLKERTKIIELKLKMPDILYQEMQNIIGKYPERIGAVYFLDEKNIKDPFTKEIKTDKIIQFREFWCYNNTQKSNNGKYQQCNLRNKCLTEIIDCQPDILKNALKMQPWKFSQLFTVFGENIFKKNEIKCFKVNLNSDIEGLVYHAFIGYEVGIMCEIEDSVGFLFLIPSNEINTRDKKYNFDAKMYIELQSFITEILIKKND
jgi:hypothetical protein